MSLLQEIWISQIQENLYPNNSFINYAVDHSQYIIGKTVHIPQANGTPSVTKNPTSFPLTVIQRTDLDFTYTVDGYVTDPIFVSDIEAVQLSYDKMGSLLRNTNQTLQKYVADSTLVNWASTAWSSITHTTGSGSTVALAPSATGSRNAITGADFASMKLLMDKHNIPQDSRYVVIDAQLYNQVLNDPTIKQQYSFGNATQQNGNVPFLYGFEIIMRSAVVSTTSGGTINAVGATGAASDNLGAIFFHKDFVSVAKGGIDIYYQAKSPQFISDVVTAKIMFGASALRKDGKGVYLLTQ